MMRKLSFLIVGLVGLWVLKDNVFAYPDCNAPDIEVGDYVIAACNVGATTVGTGSASYGSFFQRGNNYPFPSYNAQINVSTSQVDTPTRPYSNGTFIVCGYYNNSCNQTFDWANPKNYDLRGNTENTDEARQGPCATGYHVPTVAERTGIVTIGGWGSNGLSMSNELQLPLAGARYMDNGSLFNLGNYGYYWSSSPDFYQSSYEITYNLGFNKDGISPQQASWRSAAFSVRCFKNAPDTEAPVITLLGSETVLLRLGETYIESGASRTDNVDGNGTLSTPTSGSVDVNQIGTYLLEYTYTDQAGNTGNTVTRTVKVLDANAFYPGCDTPNLTVGDSTIAACNVGATTAYDGSNCTNSNCPQSVAGYVFQRGNNYGFTGTTKQGSTASEVGITTGASAIAWTASNSLWITTNPRYTDGNTTSLRGNSNNSQGPCSKGRHVPTAAEWQEVFAILGTGQDGSFLVSNALKLPPAGLRSYDTAATYNLKYIGRHWSSTPSSTTNAYNVNFDKDKIELVNNYRSYGISVRCFKNAPDTEAPVITLLGNETVLLLLGEAYIESGASWTDNVDGTGELLTATSGSVDTGTLGTYLLEYTYTDQAGNTGNTVTRTVQVLQSDLPITTPESGGGGGGGTILKKDDCPDGDFSPSYYDKECGTSTDNVGTGLALSFNTTQSNTQQSTDNNSQPEDNASIVPTEMIDAYQWAFQRGITTLQPLEKADPNGFIPRSQMAKMIVNHAVNLLQLKPDITQQCSFNDISDETEELQTYITLACQLGIMGIDMENNNFLPNDIITRAQFGTILSRLLFGSLYNHGTPYYVKHLQALQEKGILTQIDNPEQRPELRQRVRLMLMRSNEK